MVTGQLYAWEGSFMQKILAVRNDYELKMLRKIGIATVRPLSSHFTASRLTCIPGGQYRLLVCRAPLRRICILCHRCGVRNAASNFGCHLPVYLAIPVAPIPSRHGKHPFFRA
jgi:hypothetical protein